MADPRKDKKGDKFYWDPRWRLLRRRVLQRDRYRCVVCGRDVSAPGAARVDHIKPRSTHPHLAFDINNCRVCCAACDNQGHREKGSTNRHSRDERFVYGFDEQGFSLDPLHHWNAK